MGSDQIAELEARLARAQTRQEEIDALNDLAWELRNHDTERAFALSEKAGELSITDDFSAQPYKQGQASSLTTRAYLNREQGKLDLALDRCFQALALFDADVPSRAAIDCLRLISWIYYFLGDHSNALSYGFKALKLSQTLNLEIQEASVQDNLAMIYAASGDGDQAIQYHADALAIARQTGDETLESVVLNNSALVWMERGDYARAFEMGDTCLAIARRLALTERQIAVLDTLGQILQKQNEYARAEQALAEAVALSTQTHREIAQAYCLLSLGGVYLAQHDLERAQANFRQALDVALRIGARPVQMDCHAKLAQVCEEQKDWPAALDHHKSFHALYKEINSENARKRLAALQVAHQVETAKRDAEIYELRNEELAREIEERKRMEQALQELASTDPLTGLYNRRHFFSVAGTLLEHAQRFQHPLSILVIDLDHLKPINDAHGHATGEEAIKSLAANIRHSIRSVDVAARFGGDEFVVLLPETASAQAAQVAERLRLLVAENPLAVGGSNLHLTLSIGVASTFAQTEISTIETLLEQADRALYAAKQAGRNQVRANR